MSGRANPLVPRRAVVEERVAETADTVTLTFAARGGDLCDAQPGQFNMLGFAGLGEAPFSFSSIPPGGSRFVHTVRTAGNVSRAVWALEPGREVDWRGPYGRGWPLDRARGRGVVVVGGGIGIAPLRPAIRRLLDDRGEYGNLFFAFGARTEADLPFRRELEALAAAPPEGTTVRLTVDRKTEPGGPIAEGLVTAPLEEIAFPLEGSVAFSCGPELMMRFVARALFRRGQRPADHFVSLERRMECGVAQCGHCQIGAKYVCLDGPVFAQSDIARFADVIV